MTRTHIHRGPSAWCRRGRRPRPSTITNAATAATTRGTHQGFGLGVQVIYLYGQHILHRLPPPRGESAPGAVARRPQAAQAPPQ